MKILLWFLTICVISSAASEDCEDEIFCDDVVTVANGDGVDQDLNKADEYDDGYYYDDEVFNKEESQNIEIKCTNLEKLGNEDVIFDIRELNDVTQDCNKNSPCSDYSNQGFVCAPYQQCDNSKVLTSGGGVTNLIDLRSSLSENLKPQGNCVNLGGTLDASDMKCDREGDVCCKNPNVDVEICKEVPNQAFEKCGRTSHKTTITKLDQKKNGSAQPGEFTHMCVIYRITPGGASLYHAGASLIAKNKVITVAHKFWVTRKKSSESVDYRNSVSDFKVRCGEYNVRKEQELIHHQETEAAAMFFHPLYNPTNNLVPNDLVILRTKHNFIYQDHIGPVCLPLPTDNFESDEECYSSGWGQKQFKATDSYSDILKKIDMGIIPSRQCNARMKKKLRRFNAHQSMVCVGGERGKDTCTGDGGSPHVCKRDGQWVQVGVVSWGIKCGLGFPSIYASISDAMCWIDQIMTCVPLAPTDVNNGISRDERTAGDSKSSINKLTQQSCAKWDVDVPEIGDCQVTYGDDDDDDNDYDIRNIDNEE